MKLGFLVVLAVAVLVPSLSEGRIVSRCELREKLDEALVLSPRLEKLKERILATLICELSRRTHLNTEFVRIYGFRKTKTTTVSPTTPEPTTPGPIATEPEVTEPEVTEPEVTEPEVTEPEVTEPEVTEPEATRPQTTRPTTTRPLTTGPLVTRPQPAPRTTTTTAVPATHGPLHRRKRSADSSEESDSSDSSSASMSEEEEDSMEIGEAENPTYAVDMSGESMSEEEEEAMSDSNGEVSEQGGKRKKRSYGRWKPIRRWSLGFYGIFGLSDRSFCDSGYIRSWNKCRTSCDAFTNDDIMDDIDCLVRTGLWKNFIYQSSWFCRRAALPNRYYFSGCELNVIG